VGFKNLELGGSLKKYNSRKPEFKIIYILFYYYYYYYYYYYFILKRPGSYRAAIPNMLFTGKNVILIFF
jgi:hypothetical protein